MPFGLGFGETVLIFLVLVLLFGPGKIPEIGGALGKGIKDFKAALNDRQDENRMYPPPAAPHLPPPDTALPWGTEEQYAMKEETEDRESPWVSNSDTPAASPSDD
jgi:TatA/E family protein of Tat protein translocase